MTNYEDIEYKKRNHDPAVSMGSEYQFVPTALKVEPSPLGKPSGAAPAVSHSRPVPGGLSGLISVDFYAETPVLFGMSGGEKTTVPAKFREQYVMPGRAAKGMIKSVFRIATASALEPVNKHHKFGTRSFERLELWKEKHGLDDNEPLKRGWLVPTNRRDLGDRHAYEWNIGPASESTGDDFLFEVIIAKFDLPKLLGILKVPVKVEDSEPTKRENTLKKLKQLSSKGRREFFKTHLLNILGPDYENDFVVATGGSTKKLKEAVFGPIDETAPPLVVSGADMDQILQINSKYSKGGSVFAGGAKRKVDGNFELFTKDYAAHLVNKLRFKDAEELLSDLGLVADGAAAQNESLYTQGYPGIPVYYYELNKPDGTKYPVFGTAQVFKLANDHGVGEVHAERPKVKYNGEFIDWTDALFGTIDAWRDDLVAADQRKQTPLAGRVMFGFGKATGAEPMGWFKVTQGAPKASFDPYYLREKAPGTPGKPSLKGAWDSDSVVLAGHKRYPACLPYGADFGVACAEDANLGTTEARVQPLESGVTFTVPIRFENLHPLELGALLWSISFGDREVFAKQGTTKYRHVGGRLRNKGLGRLRPVNAQFVRLRQNPLPKELELKTFKPEEQIDALMLAFERAMGRLFMAQRVNGCSASQSAEECFYAAEPITTLLNLSDANWAIANGMDIKKISALPSYSHGNKAGPRDYFTPFMSLRKALYQKTAPYNVPIHALLDHFFTPLAKPTPAIRPDPVPKAFDALTDPVAVLKEWRGTNPALLPAQSPVSRL